MTHWLSFGGLLACGLLGACSGSGEADPNVGAPAGTTQTTAAATAIATATPSVEASATASATASVAPKPEPPKVVHDVDDAAGVRRMAKWDGPQEGEAITTKKAWVVAPNVQVEGSTKLSFAMQALRLVDVVKSDGKELVYELSKNQYAVPAALARAGGTKGAKKGMAAHCDMDGSHLVGRLDAVDAKSASCTVRFLDVTKKVKLTPDDVLPIKGDKLGFGSTVMVSTTGSFPSSYEGWVVAESATEVWVAVEWQFSDKSKLVNGVIYKLDRANVVAIDAAKPLKVGDPCLARQIASMAPCKVATAIDGGVAYTVTFNDGGASPWKEWAMGIVAPAPKAAAVKGDKK